MTDFLKSNVYCPGSLLELLSGLSVFSVCHDSKVFRVLWFPLTINELLWRSRNPMW